MKKKTSRRKSRRRKRICSESWCVYCIQCILNRTWTGKSTGENHRRESDVINYSVMFTTVAPFDFITHEIVPINIYWIVMKININSNEFGKYIAVIFVQTESDAHDSCGVLKQQRHQTALQVSVCDFHRKLYKMHFPNEITNSKWFSWLYSENINIY